MHTLSLTLDCYLQTEAIAAKLRSQLGLDQDSSIPPLESIKVDVPTLVKHLLTMATVTSSPAWISLVAQLFELVDTSLSHSLSVCLFVSVLISRRRILMIYPLCVIS